MSFAFDDGRVAWMRRGCGRVDMRFLEGTAARSFGTSGTCDDVGGSVGLAAGRAYWTRRDTAGTRLLTPALRDPVVRPLVLYPYDGEDGDVVGPFGADESVFALAGSTYVDGVATAGWVRRFVWGDPRNTCPAPPGASIAVAGGLVTSAHDGTAEVRDGATRALRASVAPPGAIRALAVGNGVLALLVDGTAGARRIWRFDALNGALLGRLEVPAETAPRLDLSAGRIAYRVGNSIRLLALASGTSKVAWMPRRRPLGLSLEGRKLAWAENWGGRARVWTLTLPR